MTKPTGGNIRERIIGIQAHVVKKDNDIYMYLRSIYIRARAMFLTFTLNVNEKCVLCQNKYLCFYMYTLRRIHTLRDRNVRKYDTSLYVSNPFCRISKVVRGK